MPDAFAAAAEFLRLLASAALREGEPSILSPRANDALRDVFAQRKSLVLDVQFTGFSQKGQLVGGVDPVLLRAAGHLITLRVNRVGFTPDATDEGLTALFEAVAKTTADLAGEGVVGYLSRTQPRGIYLSTSTGEVYRPPAAPAPEPATTAESGSTEGKTADPSPSPEVSTASVDTTPSVDAETAAPPSAQSPSSDPARSTDAARSTGSTDATEAERPAATSGTAPLDDDEEFDLSAFEVVEEVPVLGSAAAPGAPAAAAPGEPRAEGGGEVGGHDMFHFFRAVKNDRTDEEAEELPRLLAEAENPTRFDELAQAATRAALRLVRSDLHAQAVDLLDALVREAERPDRTRIFRESAVQSLRRVGTGETLHHLADLLGNYGGQERERILRLFVFLGGDAIPLLETILFRTVDADLRRDIFTRLSAVEGMTPRILARAMNDPSPARAKMMLELAALPGVDPELSLKWVAEAAQHVDTTVRVEAARHASTVGGRGGLRVLLDLLNDPERVVKRAALQSLGVLGDAAAVPFLTRVLTESSDEELRIVSATSLGKIGSAEALPALIGIVNKRGFLGTRKDTRVKTAALAAVGKIPSPASREFLQSVAAGKDAELSEEARRALATLP